MHQNAMEDLGATGKLKTQYDGGTMGVLINCADNDGDS